jgi:pyruvate/2-oxoglutarate dehydrogenase complex dihydrolipoamide acyltransferase (E2) component
VEALNAVSLFEFRLPDLGKDAPDRATVSFWYFEEGEDVEEKADIVEMVTDKATFNVPSPVAGRLVEIRASDGTKVKVGEVLGVLEVEG